MTSSSKKPRMHPLVKDFENLYNTANPFMAKNVQFYPKGHYHIGCDLKVPSGTLIYAPTDGEIYKVESNPAKGNTCVFIFTDEKGVTWGLELCHLTASYPIGKYKKGDTIAVSGNTGTATTAPHLHFVMHWGALVRKNYQDITGPSAVLDLVKRGKIINGFEYFKARIKK